MPVWFTVYVVIFLFILALPSQPPFFLLLTQCDGCLDDTVWGLMAGLWGLPVMGAAHC